MFVPDLKNFDSEDLVIVISSNQKYVASFYFNVVADCEFGLNKFPDEEKITF